MDVIYAGEQLFAGNLGHALAIVAFVAAVLSLSSYIFSIQAEKSPLDGTAKSWKRIGDWSFMIHALAIIGVVGVLYYLIFGHHFEYEYVRRHTSETMPQKYLISAFWSGQQGSFLLWIFWHAILGVTILFSAKAYWLKPVLAVFSVVQIILVSMVLGIFLPRWIPLLVLFLALNIPLWLLLKKYAGQGWASLVPFYNIFKSFTSAPSTRAKVMLVVLSLPLTLLVIYFALNAGESLQFLVHDIRLGVSPFVLTREEFGSNAIFLFDDYISQLKGKGLNPLLQNNWMVIHPPTLFYGFASTLVPFAFAIAGLWRNDFGGWIKPVLPWTIVATMVLGIGILLGGMWAYEALSFGGFWAWDPVENASLVPWITLIAALHTMLIFKATGQALKTTFVLVIISFFLILYSTFLTRSGILGDSSVHSFTDLGMMGQLIVLIVALIVPAFIWLFVKWRLLPIPAKEEKTSSREFWMFIGSLVLMVSAVQITFTTSTPVINKINQGIINVLPFLEGVPIFKTNWALPEDVEGFYNRVQVWIGIAIGLLTAVVQFFRYKNTDFRQWARQITPTFLISLVITGLVEILMGFGAVSYMLLFLSGLFAVLANLHYLFVVVKGKLNFSGAAIAHVGFGLVLAGIIVSFSESEVISKNREKDFGEGFDADFEQNNVFLVKNRPTVMGDYLVTFIGKKQEGIDLFYQVQYEQFNQTGELEKAFMLEPHLLLHPEMGLVPNPSTKKFPHRDIFTHVTSIPMNKDKQPIDGPLTDMHEIELMDSFSTNVGTVVFENIQSTGSQDTLAVLAQMKLQTAQGYYRVEPILKIQNGRFVPEPFEIPELNLTISFLSVNPETGKFTFRVEDDNEWIIMKAIVFPYINVVWLGICILMAGFMIAMWQRIREYERSKKREKV